MTNAEIHLERVLKRIFGEANTINGLTLKRIKNLRCLASELNKACASVISERIEKD